MTNKTTKTTKSIKSIKDLVEHINNKKTVLDLSTKKMKMKKKIVFIGKSIAFSKLIKILKGLEKKAQKSVVFAITN